MRRRRASVGTPDGAIEHAVAPWPPRPAPRRTRAPATRLTTSGGHAARRRRRRTATWRTRAPRGRRWSSRRADRPRRVTSASAAMTRPLSSRQHADAGAASTVRAASSAARSVRYWPARAPGQPPVVDGAERGGHGVGRGVEQRRAESATPGDGGHTWPHAVAGLYRRPDVRTQGADVAVIDVAGFVADLKDHAVDHGFHVHDERHFVETYSLRQAWEVDLHPEEACGGPLDLHLVARGRPARRCSRSRTTCSSCPRTTTTRPTSFTFPLHVHLGAAAAAQRARPARAGHRAGRRRRARPAARGVGHRLVRRRSPTPRAQPVSIVARVEVVARPACTSARSSSATCSTAASR